MKKEITEAFEKIREECDNIEENIEPKKVSTRGDPIVRLH